MTVSSHQPESLAASFAPLRSKWLGVGAIMAVVGLGAALGHAFMAPQGYRRFMLAYLVGFAFILSLSLGGLFFVLIQHLTRAGWSVLLRRFPEAMALNLRLVAVLFIPIAVSVLMGHGEIYPWAVAAGGTGVPPVHHESPLPLGEGKGEGAAHSEHSPDITKPPAAASNHESEINHHESHASPLYAHQTLDALTLQKRAWLNPTFFLARCVFYLAFWSLLSYWLWKTSVKQDATADHTLTARMEAASAPMLLLFGVTLTFGAFDMLMSLNPHWFSTIFGVYYFAGCVVSSLAMIILLIQFTQNAGALPRTIGTEHKHDLGKLLFAFTFFWGYIAFSQYMLLWYAHLPETTGWLRLRGATTAEGSISGWSYVALLLLFANFILPFVGLLSRHVKRKTTTLVFWAGWLLVAHWLDLYWLVMPEFSPQPVLGLIELGTALGLSGLFLAGLAHNLASANLIPTGDPRLPESIAFENI